MIDFIIAIFTNWVGDVLIYLTILMLGMLWPILKKIYFGILDIKKSFCWRRISILKKSNSQILYIS